MKQTVVPVKPDGKLNVKATEDLCIQGYQDKFLTAIVDQSDALKLIEENGVIAIKASANCRLLVPETMTVTVEKCSGDAVISNLKTRLILGRVGGDLTVQSVGGISVEMVEGDLTFREAAGGVEIARVSGDLNGDGLSSLSSGAVSGDVVLRNINGKVNLVADGDVELASMLVELPEMDIRAAGDLTLIVSPSARGQLELYSSGEEIEVHACLQDVEMEEQVFSLPLGEGGNILHLSAGGSIKVSDQEKSTEFGDVFDHWDETWENFGARLEKRIREGFDRAAESLELARDKTDMVHDKLEQAMHQVERKTADIGKKWVGVVFDSPAPLKEKPKSGMSEEERLMVLRMLQEKKISVEEADRLLNALDK